MIDSATIELLAARAHIADVVHRYAQIIRTGNIAECTTLFTPDATFEVREATPGDASSLRTRSKVSGHDAILEYVGKSAAAASVCPLIHNLLIDVNGSEATSSALMTAVMLNTGQTLLGEYHDTFRNAGGAWRFSARVYTIFRPRS